MKILDATVSIVTNNQWWKSKQDLEMEEDVAITFL